jgi:hypothetical protein
MYTSIITFKVEAALFALKVMKEAKVLTIEHSRLFFHNDDVLQEKGVGLV